MKWYKDPYWIVSIFVILAWVLLCVFVLPATTPADPVNKRVAGHGKHLEHT